MREYKADTIINAPVNKVWPILIDTAKWREWDPNCIKVEGAVALGAKLKVWTKLSPKRAFPVKVSELVLHQKMTWTGGMPLGLFKGVRTYTLREAEGTGHTHFMMHEVFSGPLLGMIGKSIPDMTEAFQQFAAGLKQRSESAK